MAGDSLVALIANIAFADRIFGVLLFGAAAFSKLRHFDEFVSIVARYLTMPLSVARIAAVMVLGLEILTVGLLCLPVAGHAGAVLAISLLLLFAVAMALALLRGETQLDCGCMSTALRQRVRWTLVVRNVLMALLFLPMLTRPDLPAEPLALMDGLAAGIVLFILYLATDVLVALDASFADLKRRYG